MNANAGRTDVSAMLSDLTTVGPDVLEKLHGRLVDAADRDGILDVAYRTIDTPVGSLLLAATREGLVRVAFHSQGHDVVLEQLATTVSPRILRAPQRLDRVAREIDEYFARRRTSFDVPLDFVLATGFGRVVLEHLPQIAYGHTESYAEVARTVGNPRAARAVGSACATNPMPVVIPCHRVLRADGSLGGYVGGPEAKAALLDLEAVAA